MADIPPPPAGFTLDAPTGSGNNIPPPPAGFTIDAPAQQQQAPQPQSQGQTAVAAQPPVQAPQDQSYTGSVLPFSKDAQGHVHFDANAGLLGSAIRAITAPGDAYKGNLQVLDAQGNVTPEAQQRVGDFVGTFGVTPSPALGTGPRIAQIAAQGVERPGMEAAAAAQRLGVNLPRAVTTDSPTVAQLGKVATNIPVAGTPLRTASQTAIDQLGEAANRIQQGYGTGDIPGAGAAVRQDVTNYGTKTLPGQVSDAYNVVDSLVDQAVKTPLTATQQKAAEIVARRNNATLGDGQAANIVKAATQPITDASGAPTPNPGLNYQGIKDLRTSIGEMMDNPQIAPQGTSQNELKAIYGSLTDDLKSAAQNAGGQSALDAWQEANSLAKATAAERENLDRIVAPQSDEGLFSRLHAMAGTNSSADLAQLARARKAVSPETWNDVASGVIAKMGRDADGNFSPDRFITAYGKLSPNGKNLLFRSTGKDDLADSLEDIATVSRRFKQLNQYANPSGTGQTVSAVSLAQGAIAAPIPTIGSVVGGRVLSGLLARPVSARAIAAYSRAYQGAVTRPSAAATNALLNSSRAVASIAANAAGDKTLAQTFLPQLMTINKLPAAPGNENLGATEN